MPQPQPQRETADPAVVDTEHYSIITEDEHVRVLRVRYAPRSASVMHGHPKHVAIALSAGRFRFTFPDGTRREVDFVPGEALIAPSGDHLPEYLGEQPFDAVLVELKAQA